MGRWEEVAFPEFVYTPTFEASAAGVLDDTAMRKVELQLLRDVARGAVIPGTGGLRKLRVALRGMGKRGGARVVYFAVPARERVYFLLTYGKRERIDLSPSDKRTLRALARRLQKE